MRKELGMLCALGVLCLIIGFSNHDFIGASNLTNTCRQVAMLGIFAIGVSFVITTGGIDLSIGSVIGLTAVLIAKFSAPYVEGVAYGFPIGVGICIALAVALLIGLIQGLLITRLNLQPFIVTLGGMLLLKGVSQVITGGGTISFGSHGFRDIGDEGWKPLSFLVNPQHGQTELTFWDQLGAQQIPWPVLMFVAVALLATYLLHFTVFGRHVFAIGGNRDAALYSGVPVKRVETLTYVISAGLAGIAGIAYAAYVPGITHTLGEGYELYAITAVVIGGCSLRGGEGTILGMVIGAAVIKVLDNGINLFKITYTAADGKLVSLGLNDTWRNVIIGAVILVAVILDQMSHVLKNRKRTATAQAKPAVPVKPAAG